MTELTTKYKILTWNILASHHYEKRIDDIAKYIHHAKADIVLLQETDDQYADQTLEAFGRYGYVLKLQPGNHDAGEISGIGIAYNPAAFREVDNADSLNINFRTISLDLLPIDKSNSKRAVRYVGQKLPHLESPLDFGNDILTVISYHGTWGCFAQPQRLAEVTLIDDFARDKGNAVILGGDFNATPTEPAVQYLAGNLINNQQSTYWAEAQDLIAQMGGAQPHPTSFTSGPVIDASPRFDLHHTPERRIDYLFNYGFSYGRQYSFDGWTHGLDINRARALSDHAPLLAGLLDG